MNRSPTPPEGKPRRQRPHSSDPRKGRRGGASKDGRKRSRGNSGRGAPPKKRRLDASAASSDPRYGRGARWGLALLLFVAAIFASGALLAQFNLKALGNTLEGRLAEHVGSRVELGSVHLNGIRGIVLKDMSVEIETDTGPRAQIDAPRVAVFVSLFELLSGRLRIERIALDDTRVIVERPDDAPWYDAEGFDLRDLFDFPASRGFRLTGRNCVLEVRNIVGGTNAIFEDIGFDVAKLAGAKDLTANAEGYLGGDRKKLFEMRLSMAAFDDFELSAEHRNLTADDANLILPSRHHFVASGIIHPSVWVSARPGQDLLVSVESPYEELVLRDQPDFFNPANGRLAAYATYSPDSRLFSITTAKTESSQISGALEGSVKFDGMYPEFDLRLEATRLPVQELLDYWGLEGKIEDYGGTELVLNEPQSVTLSLRGTSDEPKFVGEVYAPSGTFVLAPRSPSNTRVRLELGAIEATWNSTDETLTGHVSVVDGQIEHKESELTATQLRGTLRIMENEIVADPLSAALRGMPITAQVRYDRSTTNADITLSGVLARLEETPIHDAIRHTLISGDLTVRQAAIEKRGEQYHIEADVDASQLLIEHDWWYRKARGVGATGRLTADYVPDQSASIEASGEIASTIAQATAELLYDAGRERPWRLESATAQSDDIDVAGLGQCLKLPYRISGSKGRDGHFRWDRDHSLADGWRQAAGATFDELSLLPLTENAVTPMSFRALKVEAETWTGAGAGDTAEVTLQAVSARMPKLSEPWLLPFDMTPPEGLSPKNIERDWQYHLAADQVQIPPWEGTNLEAEAFSNPDAAGFTAYHAIVGDGRIGGSYDLQREDNFFSSSVEWENVPAETLIEHLGFAKVLEGNLTGGINYKMDKDDPGTLRGEGRFSVTEGQFSADYVASILEGHTGNHLSALPPSLRFSEFKGELVLDGDVVGTPTFSLVSEDIMVDGSGEYIREGDMDYRIRVALSPTTAERIPALSENLNLKGYRISNQNIELGFRVSGPTFNPQGKVEGMPPMGVTLVSGITEVTSSVIDFPRRILVDLLKMGGGMLGAGR